MVRREKLEPLCFVSTWVGVVAPPLFPAPCWCTPRKAAVDGPSSWPALSYRLRALAVVSQRFCLFFLFFPLLFPLSSPSLFSLCLSETSKRLVRVMKGKFWWYATTCVDLEDMMQGVVRRHVVWSHPHEGTKVVRIIEGKKCGCQGFGVGQCGLGELAFNGYESQCCGMIIFWRMAVWISFTIVQNILKWLGG